MSKHAFEVFSFSALDGFTCNLWRLRTDKELTKGPVLLVHGAGVSGEIFDPPNDKNLIDALVEDGYDVWLENWRGSIVFHKNQWDLDLAAENDHPEAVKEVCRITGYQTIKAIIHCQGSTSFMISAVKGLIPQVTTIVSNAVSLHPIVSKSAKFKLNYVLPLVKPLTKYLNPSWGDLAPDLTSKFFKYLVLLSHRENDTNVGKFVSFIYGYGKPALWELENLNETTKEWIRKEFGNVPLSFFDQIKKGVQAESLVAAHNDVNYGNTIPKTNARIVLLAGKLNKCFSCESQEKTFQYLNAQRPNFHKLKIFDKYSHLDIFLGKNAYSEVFPTIIQELNN